MIASGVWSGVCWNSGMTMEAVDVLLTALRGEHLTQGGSPEKLRNRRRLEPPSEKKKKNPMPEPK